MAREQWAKIDVDMPTDDKLFGRPLLERHLWTCLICLAKKLFLECGDATIYNLDAGALNSRFNLGSTPAVEKGLRYFETCKPRPMIRRADGSIFLLNFAKRQSRELEARTPGQKRRGYVYFARAATSGRIKIGFSSNPWARVNELQTGSADAIEIAAAAPATIDVERQLHERFKAMRVNREWFEPTADLLKLVATVAATKQLPSQATLLSVVAATPPATVAATVATTSQESREVDLDQAAVVQIPNATDGPAAASWDEKLLARLREAFGVTELTSKDFADFLLSSARFPKAQREAATQEFLARQCAEAGKGFGYLLRMIQGGAGPAKPNGRIASDGSGNSEMGQIPGAEATAKMLAADKARKTVPMPKGFMENLRLRRPKA